MKVVKNDQVDEVEASVYQLYRDGQRSNHFDNLWEIVTELKSGVRDPASQMGKMRKLHFLVLIVLSFVLAGVAVWQELVTVAAALVEVLKLTVFSLPVNQVSFLVDMHWLARELLQILRFGFTKSGGNREKRQLRSCLTWRCALACKQAGGQRQVACGCKVFVRSKVLICPSRSRRCGAGQMSIASSTRNTKTRRPWRSSATS